jgi:threonine/homoserine/homoserine lactone efflux protein
MSFDLWLAFAAASTVLLVMPGPTLLLVLSYAMTQGRRVAVACALGVATGDLIAMTLSVIGLGALLLTSATAFTLLKWAGAAYLIFLAVKMLCAAPASFGATGPEPPSQRSSKVYRDLATVTALNPKSNTFFIAFVPQFIDPGAAYAPQAALLIATFVGIAGANALVFALAANAMRARLSRPRTQIWLNRGGALALLGMAVATATARRAPA